MPWRETDAMDQRIQFVVRALEEKANRSELCREFGISRKTGYKWIKRYGEVGSLQALVPKSRRPKHSPRQTSPEVEERVEALRNKHGWGGGKLSCMLHREGVDLPPGTVDRILRRRGLTGPAPDGRAALKRFERSTPNDLWQIDFKGPMQWKDAWSSTPLSVLDDHSRFVVGLAPLRSLTDEAAMPPLRVCFEQYGLPTTILMDHGTPWWSTTNGHGLTRFSIRLIQQGIRLIYGRIRHPQTQGKVERFHRTLKSSFQHRYRLSKAALNALTVILASKLRGGEVLVNALSPGWVQTEMGGPGAPRTAAEGADTAVYLATLPPGGPTGRMFKDRKVVAW